MRRSLAILLAGLWVGAITAGAQTAKPVSARHYAPPRTPWGDPDLQGTYTNKYELNTPFERPKEFEGRRADDVDDGRIGGHRSAASGAGGVPPGWTAGLHAVS